MLCNYAFDGGSAGDPVSSSGICFETACSQVRKEGDYYNRYCKADTCTVVGSKETMVQMPCGKIKRHCAKYYPSADPQKHNIYICFDNYDRQEFKCPHAIGAWPYLGKAHFSVITEKFAQRGVQHVAKKKITTSASNHLLIYGLECTGNLE
ncbi:uncharacterized protein MELLADRAFT_108891 [Melampsora larici-populina 98AG31]|uniref:Uncharacterized protein n=1 Tax=Melampsora larici-populina (strain 98AG31 / pathotype 3-4-7) TaxID=747676 RepID=F4RUM6_MELLP|nr:uncharacterized protein MELLADRAFT_108891 [Melampsora larici-populina 98AG31]EGG03958.1 hypothetical protein MELLADRAFT_108891 [Melampsora larici-populina 98AG31]